MSALLRLREMVDQLDRRGGVRVQSFGADDPTEVRVDLVHRFGDPEAPEQPVITLADLRLLIDAAAAPADTPDPKTGT